MRLQKATQKDCLELSFLEEQLFSKVNYRLSYSSFYYHVKNNLLYVVKDEEKIVAYLLVLIKRKDAKIYSLGVLPAFRSQNIAKKLLLKAMKSICKLGFKKCSLEVRTDNANAIFLYEKFGFSIKKEVESFYLDNCSAYIMEATACQKHAVA